MPDFEMPDARLLDAGLPVHLILDYKAITLAAWQLFLSGAKVANLMQVFKLYEG